MEGRLAGRLQLEGENVEEEKGHRSHREDTEITEGFKKLEGEAAVVHGMNGGDEILRRLLLDHVSGDPALTCLLDQCRAVVHGKDDNARIDVQIVYCSGGPNTVEFRHEDIHDDYIGYHIVRKLNGFTAVGSRADNFDVFFSAKQSSNILADYFVVVNNQYANQIFGHIHKFS